MKLIELISKRPPVVLLFISVITFLALGKTLEFYFYTDDYAVLYHFINNIPYIYPFYVFVPKLYGPIYNLFGLNPLPYFSLALITHILASLSVYFLARKITKNNLIALFSSLIFATGYIGVDSFSQMNTVSVDSLNVLFTMLLVLFFYSFLENKKIIFYGLALLIFYLGVTIFPFRAFPMILFLLTTDLVFSLRVKKFIPSSLEIFLRNLPFIVIYYLSSLALRGTGVFSNFINNFSSEYFSLFFSILGSMIIPRALGTFLDRAIIGFIFLAILLAIVLLSRRKFAHLSKALFLSVIFLIEGFIGFFLLLPVFSTNNAEVNRYFSLSLASFSIAIPLASFLFFKLFLKGKKEVPSSALPLSLIVIFSLLSFNYQNSLVKERSMYAREFFEQLKKYVPNIDPNEVNFFYFDRANYNPVQYHFGPIILGAYMGSEATLAVHYKVPVDKVSIVRDFDDLKNSIRKGKANLNNIYTFYYDENGLTDTTDEIKKSLISQKSYLVPIDSLVSDLPYVSGSSFKTESIFAESEKGILFKSPEVSISPSSIPSYSPSTLNFDLAIAPKIPRNFPLLDSADDPTKINNKPLYFSYISSRKNYYKEVKVEVSSSHPLQSKEFLIDNNSKTYWFTEEGPWQVGRVPWVKIDMGRLKEISRILWVNVSSVRTPTDYEILTSVDGVDWKGVKRVKNGSQKGNEEIISDSFTRTTARLVMIKIYKTTDNWAPGFSEIEIVEDKYKEVDPTLARRLEKKPFEYIKNQEELNLTLDYIISNAEINFLIKTNSDKEFNPDKQLRLSVLPDGQYHSYQVTLPAGGLYFKEIKLEALNFPATIELRNISIQSRGL